MNLRPQQFTLALPWYSALNASAAALYVDVNITNPVPPYTNWSTAARDIQPAVDASATGDSVPVTNGTYATGGPAVYGTMTNRVAVDRPITVQGVNGPSTIRCADLTNSATLSGFMQSNLQF